MKPGDHDDVVPDFYPVHSVPKACIEFETRVWRALRIESWSILFPFEFRSNPPNWLKRISIHGVAPQSKNLNENRAKSPARPGIRWWASPGVWRNQSAGCFSLLGAGRAGVPSAFT